MLLLAERDDDEFNATKATNNIKTNKKKNIEKSLSTGEKEKEALKCRPTKIR